MKKSILRIMLGLVMAICLCAGALAQNYRKHDSQVGAQSLGLEWSEGKIGVTYLNDGIDGLAGIQFTPISGKNSFLKSDKLSLNIMAVSDWKNRDRQYYVGTTLGYRFYEKNGVTATGYIGIKGFNFSDGFSNVKFEQNNPIVFGFGIKVPIN